jgi:hypothetical protein
MCPALLSFIRAALASFALAALMPKAQADDWPMLGRNQTRNSVSPEKKPPTWWQHELREIGQMQSERNIKWKAELGSTARGEPVVAGGLVWLGFRGFIARPR